MGTDYCDYPPRIAADVEINEQCDGDQPAFIIGSAAVGRYLLLRAVEYRVLQLLGAYPDHVFRGRVAKIGGESETAADNQVIYRVELVIENTGDLLRPGMTAFARIDFGRRMIGRILLHKLRQALRPELWMI